MLPAVSRGKYVSFMRKIFFFDNFRSEEAYTCVHFIVNKKPLIYKNAEYAYTYACWIEIEIQNLIN